HLPIHTPVSLAHSYSFFNHPATTETYTLSLHDALPISPTSTSLGPTTRPNSVSSTVTRGRTTPLGQTCSRARSEEGEASRACLRSEEHTSELQSRENLVCRLLLEKKKKKQKKKKRERRE